MKTKHILKTVGLATALSFSSIALISCDDDNSSSSSNNSGNGDNGNSSEVTLPNGFNNLDRLIFEDNDERLTVTITAPGSTSAGSAELEFEGEQYSVSYDYIPQDTSYDFGIVSTLPTVSAVNSIQTALNQQGSSAKQLLDAVSAGGRSELTNAEVEDLVDRLNNELNDVMVEFDDDFNIFLLRTIRFTVTASANLLNDDTFTIFSGPALNYDFDTGIVSAQQGDLQYQSGDLKASYQPSQN